MFIKIRKIKEIPFRINSEVDEVLADNLTFQNHMQVLEELGYCKDAKMKIIDGTHVYYKGRKNGVYFQYSLDQANNMD